MTKIERKRTDRWPVIRESKALIGYKLEANLLHFQESLCELNQPNRFLLWLHEKIAGMLIRGAIGKEAE